MFKGEYQGGPFVEVFSAQGRDSLSKKCKVTGTSANIHKQYDKDVKSYVYVLEGEPITTKIQFPKEDKQGLFLTQKFLVFQLYLPVGRPFSFEVAISDHDQNKRRIFFSSNLKDISVTPLHAKFPLTALNLGSWLNLCLDLESLVSETFSGPKFRAVESFTVTANCRLKKVFTLRAPPLDTSEDQSHANSEPLPKNLQLMTTSHVSTVTQILTYSKLHNKSVENHNTPVSTPSGHEGSTPRQDQETHIAFGTKVVIPPHVRKNSFKENRENTSSKIPYNSRLASSKTKHTQSSPDVRYTHDDSVKYPLTPKENHETKSGSVEAAPRGIDATQATIQPRPPRTSSAGKIRRPIRLKSSSTSKARTDPKTDCVKDKQPNSFETEKSSVSIEPRPQEEINPRKSENLDVSNDVRTSLKSSDNSTVNHKLESRLKSAEIKGDESCQSFISGTQNVQEKYTMEHELKNGRVNKSSNLNQNRIDNNIHANADALKKETLSKASYRGDLRSSENITNDSEHQSTTSKGLNGLIDEQKDASQILYLEVNSVQSESKTAEKINEMHTNATSNSSLDHTSKSTEVSNANGLVNMSVTKQSFDNMTVEQNTKNCDVNNNNSLIDNDIEKPRTKPRILPLASNNSVFTFASIPRSPRSGKKKLLGSPMIDDVFTPNLEAPPEVMVSLAEDAIPKDPPDKSDFKSQRNRGASLEDDFCKLSDDDCDEDGGGIQKLLQSSLSPRHSPMPFHHQLRQSIRSSMLKEIPSPIKENGYVAQNYQSDDHLATFNQSTASSWRFDTSDSSNSFNQTQQDLEDSLNSSSFPKPGRHFTAIADVPLLDDNDDDGHSDWSDDTTNSTWREPPHDLRGNKYQNEMKPPVKGPDLTATISMDPRNSCDVFSPPIVLGTPGNKESNSAVPLSSPLKSPLNQNFPGANQEEEEELDLLYDPCLNCYFDPKTHKYYELA